MQLTKMFYLFDKDVVEIFCLMIFKVLIAIIVSVMVKGRINKLGPDDDSVTRGSFASLHCW